MHVNTFDHYQVGDSLVHRLDPRVKVVLTVLFILSNVLLPDGAWVGFILAWGMVIAWSKLARLSISFVLTRSFIVLPFALAAVTTTFSTPGETLVAIDVGPWLVVFTQTGVARFVSILLRSWISVQMAILLTATTPFPDLVHALRHLHLPAVLVSTISFMYRYLFVLSDEVVRLLRAREARSAKISAEQKSGGSVVWRAKVAGSMAGQLFLRSYERSERIYNAMLARGYMGEYLTLNPHLMQRRDWLVIGMVITSLLLIQVVGRII